MGEEDREIVSGRVRLSGKDLVVLRNAPEALEAALRRVREAPDNPEDALTAFQQSL